MMDVGSLLHSTHSRSRSRNRRRSRSRNRRRSHSRRRSRSRSRNHSCSIRAHSNHLRSAMSDNFLRRYRS